MLEPYKYNKLKGKITEVFGSQKAFSEAIHRPQNTVSRKLNGLIPLSQEDIEEWGTTLGIDRTEWGCYFFT